MSLRERTREAPPSGPGWLHEIKHDGFRILARRDSSGVRLITRAGNDFSSRFPFIAMAVGKLPVRSCLIDGEAIVCDEKGLAVFELTAATAHWPVRCIARSTCSSLTIALGVVVLLFLLGWLLTRELYSNQKIEDCVLSGRTNCAPISAPATY
jgi:hypothetical protein